MNQITLAPEIDVLLATYNGAKYLDEFLTSLENQIDVRINLLVSDDGSSDNSLEIVRAHEKNFYTVTYFDGPKKGATENFYHLMYQSKAPYVAFADQDDIWEKEHLRNSIERLKPYEPFPTLTFSTSLTFFDDGRKAYLWPVLKDIPPVSELFLEGRARGCSMVFNREANSLLTSYHPQFPHCHDTWAFLVLRTCGIVIYDRAAEIRYRIHANNTIGLGERSFFRTFRTLSNRTWKHICNGTNCSQPTEIGWKNLSVRQWKTYLSTYAEFLCSSPPLSTDKSKIS
ncbi:MAG: glycosyltransferase [Actinomycetota bacterium]